MERDLRKLFALAQRKGLDITIKYNYAAKAPVFTFAKQPRDSDWGYFLDEEAEHKRKPDFTNSKKVTQFLELLPDR